MGKSKSKAKDIKKLTCEELLEFCDTDVLVTLVDKLSMGIIDNHRLRSRIENEKRLIDLRKDPEYESWWDQR